jgi:hypothetical protein
MKILTLLASTEDAAHSHSIIDGLPHLAGMLMVMVTLAFLWGICATTAVIIKSLLPDKKPTFPPAPAPDNPGVPVSATAAPSTDSTPTSGIAPEIVAVIAAAVTSVAGRQPVRIVSIKPMSTSWERAGRQSVLTSHRIR